MSKNSGYEIAIMSKDYNAAYAYKNRERLLEDCFPDTCFAIANGKLVDGDVSADVVDNGKTLGELDSRLEVFVKIGIIKDIPYTIDLGPDPLMGG